MRALQRGGGFTQRLVARRVTKGAQGGIQCCESRVLRRDQRPMRGIIAHSAGAIGDAEKFFRRTAGAQQCCLPGNFIIGQQAARPWCLAACRWRTIHGAANFLPHFFNRRQQGGAEDAVRSAKCGHLPFRFLPRLLFRFQRRAKLAQGAGKAGTGCLDAGGDIRIAAQQRIQAVFNLARTARSFG